MRLSLLLPVPLCASAGAPAPVPPPPDLATPPAEALPSGLRFRVLQAGTGAPAPMPDGVVQVHFTLWGADGQMLGGNMRADGPATLLLGNLMPGMAEGIRLMARGEARRLWLPEALAFKGAEGRPRGNVVLDVELVDAFPHPSKPPEDLAGPGPDAQVHPSGLVSRVLRPGAGKVFPRPSDWVSVHYSGWTADGRLFESTILKRSSELFRLAQTIEGWRIGIPLMSVGERRRFWIPKRLAYQGERGKPAGLLVFDVELLAVSR